MSTHSLNPNQPTFGNDSYVVPAYGSNLELLRRLLKIKLVDGRQRQDPIPEIRVPQQNLELPKALKTNSIIRLVNYNEMRWRYGKLPFDQLTEAYDHVRQSVGADEIPTQGTVTNYSIAPTEDNRFTKKFLQLSLDQSTARNLDRVRLRVRHTLDNFFENQEYQEHQIAPINDWLPAQQPDVTMAFFDATPSTASEQRRTTSIWAAAIIVSRLVPFAIDIGSLPEPDMPN